MALPKFSSNAQNRTASKPGQVTPDSLAAGWHTRTIQEALDEVARELGVRERLYARWVEEGKHSLSDAQDRMQRIIMAAALLQVLCDNAECAKQVSCHLVTEAETKPF